MEFVERKCKNKVKRENWPEFEITEDDMLETRRNSDEYIFLDVEDLEGNCSTEPTASDSGLENIGIPHDDHDSSTSSPIVSDNHESNHPEKISTNPSLRTTLNEANDKKEKALLPLTTKKEKESSSPDPVVIVKENKTEITPAKSLPGRCEDDIFGELVAAMLKRMDADKKRGVKKEIMNMLLT